MVLLLLLAVVVSGFAARLSPVKLPLPIIQIGFGAVLSHLAGFDVLLDPDVFFLLLIPPLLFMDGYRIPKDHFYRDIGTILTLAIGLVIFTVVGMGWFIDWLIPAMPLAVSYALAAILSPTDPVAVSSIAATTPIPTRLMHILEGESLLNDASGLVCFRFAVVAALTGSFSLAKASGSFMLVAGGGLIVGAAVAWGIAFCNRALVRRAGEEPAIQVLVSIFVPFASYLAAEHVHVSGILAAATAGITTSYVDLIGRPSAVTRMQRRVVWDTVQFALNGIIFVLLGQQLPRIVRSISTIASHASIRSSWRLVMYVISITLAMTALRFVWVWASIMLTMLKNRKQGGLPTTPTRLVLVAAFAGVRGAVTLAGILTLPLLMPDGSPFPARDLAIALAMGVILLSLLMASVFLPILAPGLKFAPVAVPADDEETTARRATAEAAIRKMESLRDQSPQSHPEETARLIDLYRKRLGTPQPNSEDGQKAREAANASRQLRIAALIAERDELYRLKISRKISDHLHQQMVKEIDLLETALASQLER